MGYAFVLCVKTVCNTISNMYKKNKVFLAVSTKV